MNDFFAELKRRNVYKVAVAYAIAGWLFVQIATQVFPFLEIPNWVVRLVISLVAVGFPIAPFVAWAFELTPEGIKLTEDVDLAASARQPQKRAWIVVVIVGAALSVGLFFFGRYSAQTLRQDATAARTDTAAASTVPQKSIAVLPFENLSDDKQNACFADGIQDEILTKLANIADLKVISRTSTRRFKAGGSQKIAFALAQQISGDTAAANTDLEKLIQSQSNDAGYQIAQVYALRNDPDQMFEWLERAWSNRDAGISGLLYDPFLLRYRHDPRFVAFCKRVGVPAEAL